MRDSLRHGAALRSRPLAWALAVSLTALISGTGAGAAEIWRDRSGAWVLEGNGFYKPYASWLVLPSSLVAGTQAMQAAVDGARPLLTADQAAALPADLAAPRQAGLGANTLRLGARLSWRDRLQLDAAWQITGIVTSSPSFASTGSPGYLGASLIAPQRRLVDFSPYLVTAGGALLQHDLDRLSVKYAGERFSLTVGRQALSWGTGRLWNPTDLVSPFAPTDVDREVRRGADAARLSLSLGATSQLELLWLPQQRGADNGGIVRGRTNLGGWDLSATAAKYVSDLVLGADFSGDLGPLGAHGEAAWTLPMDGIDNAKPLGLQPGFVRAVGGLDWRPGAKWIFTGEYYLNGFGARSDAELLQKLRDPRVVRGEVFGAGRHYAGLVATFLATELLTLNATALLNCTDPSAMLVPVLEYSFEQHVLVRVGGYLPLGRGVDVPALQALTANDVATSSAAWQGALSTLAARSEYGLSPMGVFVQIGLYLN